MPRLESRFLHYFDSVVPRNQNCYTPFNYVKMKVKERRPRFEYAKSLPQDFKCKIMGFNSGEEL